MPYTKLCRQWHIDRQKEKDREKELIGSVSVILSCLFNDILLLWK